MAPILPFALVGALCSIIPAAGIKTKVPDASGMSEEIDDVQDTEASTSSNDFLMGNCGELSLIGGIPMGGSVKVTVNGWEDDSRDFEAILLIEKHLTKLKGGEHKDEDASDEEHEHPAESLVGIRVVGPKDSEKKSAVLLYQSDDASPTEFPLDSPAGPTTPFMVVFTRSSSSSMVVDLYTWISGEGGVDSGKWHKVSQTVSVKYVPNVDLMLNADVNACGARVMKVYASPDTRALTVKEGTCDSIEQRLVELNPPKNPESSR